MMPLEQLAADIAGFEAATLSTLTAINARAHQLTEACHLLSQSWSGSCAGWHGRMYFVNFQKPPVNQQFNGEWGGIYGIPEGWHENTAQQVAEQLETIVGDGLTVKKFEQEVAGTRSAIEDLQSEVNTSLAVIDFSAAPSDKAVADEIAIFSFGTPKAEYVNSHIPKSLMSRDTEALRQGICIPSHVYYAAVAHEATATHESYHTYRKLVDRLIKQVRMRAAVPPPTATPGVDVRALHQAIVGKCSSLYATGAYAEAVEKSFKIVRDRLRVLTGHETGSEAFGKGKLHVKGAAAPNVDADFNQASKFLMMAIDMFRNEKSHTSDAKIDDPVRAYQYLVVSSLAMSLLDNAEILP